MRLFFLFLPKSEFCAPTVFILADLHVLPAKSVRIRYQLMLDSNLCELMYLPIHCNHKNIVPIDYVHGKQRLSGHEILILVEEAARTRLEQNIN